MANLPVSRMANKRYSANLYYYSYGLANTLWHSPADCVHRWCVIFEFFCGPWQQISYPPAMETEMVVSLCSARLADSCWLGRWFAGFATGFPAAGGETPLVAALRIAVALPGVADVGHIYIGCLYIIPSVCFISGRLVKTASSTCI